MLIGLFDAIASQKLPVRYPRLFMVTRWCSGEGEFIQQTKILKPDQTTVLVTGKEIPVRLPGSEATATNVEVFMNVAFDTFGTYWVEVYIDRTMKIRYPLRVAQVKQQPPNKQNPPSPNQAPPSNPA